MRNKFDFHKIVGKMYVILLFRLLRYQILSEIALDFLAPNNVKYLCSNINSYNSIYFIEYNSQRFLTN